MYGRKDSLTTEFVTADVNDERLDLLRPIRLECTGLGPAGSFGEFLLCEGLLALEMLPQKLQRFALRNVGTHSRSQLSLIRSSHKGFEF
jgi:hypothetical protein